jgi:hypothetical protein
MQGVDFPTTDIGFVVGWAGRILNTTDSGVTWNDQTSGTSVNLNDVSFAGNALTGIAVGESGTILRTTSGGGPSPTPHTHCLADAKANTAASPDARVRETVILSSQLHLSIWCFQNFGSEILCLQHRKFRTCSRPFAQGVPR